MYVLSFIFHFHKLSAHNVYAAVLVRVVSQYAIIKMVIYKVKLTNSGWDFNQSHKLQCVLQKRWHDLSFLRTSCKIETRTVFQTCVQTTAEMANVSS